MFSVVQFNSLFSISFERWQKTALLVFQFWLSCRQKSKVLFVRLAFFGMKHNLFDFELNAKLSILPEDPLLLTFPSNINSFFMNVY
jgi:hypothetical protein